MVSPFTPGKLVKEETIIRKREHSHSYTTKCKNHNAVVHYPFAEDKD